MTVSIGKLVCEIEKSAPLSLMEDWDNSGWQIRLGQADISRLLVALEITDAVIDEAVDARADMVLTHHPLFFVPQKKIDVLTFDGGYAARLLRAGISVYSAHTPFDAAPGGMNDVLAEMTGLTGIVPFPPKPSGSPVGFGSADLTDGFKNPIARCGVFDPPRLFGDVCADVERVLGMAGRLKTVGDRNTLLSAGAVCGGGGGDLVEAVLNAGIGFFLTSDIKHHQAQWAKERGSCLIDGGHFGTERHFAPVMADRLRGAFGPNLDVRETAVVQEPWM
jgi:dinuclear metal center YbgI/SA1388 family protein